MNSRGPQWITVLGIRNSLLFVLPRTSAYLHDKVSNQITILKVLEWKLKMNLRDADHCRKNVIIQSLYYKFSGKFIEFCFSQLWQTIFIPFLQQTLAVMTPDPTTMFHWRASETKFAQTSVHRYESWSLELIRRMCLIRAKQGQPSQIVKTCSFQFLQLWETCIRRWESSKVNLIRSRANLTICKTGRKASVKPSSSWPPR